MLQPTQSPLLNKLQATTDPRVSPIPHEGRNGKQTEKDDDYEDDVDHDNDDCDDSIHHTITL